MTLSEKLEQSLTGRPSSFIPAHTLERTLGLKTEPDDKRQWVAWVPQRGLGIVPAALRGVMAVADRLTRTPPPLVVGV